MFAIDSIIRQEVPLAPLTTLRVGGPARYYLHAGSREAVEAGIRWAAARDLPILTLGGGSNIVVADEGYAGLVLHIGIRGIKVQRQDGMVEVTAGAGENWNALVGKAVANGWAGIECLSGIPGYVGATPVQNVGAYGQEVRETISAVEALDLQTQQVVTFSNEACDFGYRASRFKLADQGRYIILHVHYRLRPDGMPAVRYAELERFFAPLGVTSPSLTDVRMAVLEIRRRKSMIHDHNDPNARSAGSFFVNPILPLEEFAMLEDAISAQLHAGERIPCFQLGDGRVKVPAAWLIERVGFTRGHQCGNVGLSAKHTLAIINHGNATAREVLALAREIRERVFQQFGIKLVPEPTFIGLSFE